MTENLLVVENLAGLYIVLTEAHTSTVLLKFAHVLLAGLNSSRSNEFVSYRWPIVVTIVDELDASS